MSKKTIEKSDLNKRFITLKRLAFTGMILGVVAIGVLSLMPDPPQPKLDIPFLDKIEHFIAYLGLGGLSVGAFYRKEKAVLVMILAAGACTLYGGALELLQHFTGRSTELADFITNILGATCGAFLGKMLFPRWARIS